MADNQLSWKESLLVYRHPRIAAMLFFGFSAGLPYLLIFSTLSAWLRDEGISRTTIGFFSWVGILFSIKVLWSPIVDSKKLPLLTDIMGQRRSWLLLAQLGIMLSLAAMAFMEPTTAISTLAKLAIAVAFFSATQDICIDAYRIEAADKTLQGAMAASYILGYRSAMLAAGAGAFYIADWSTWNYAYFTMAGLMVVGVITTLLVAEPKKVVDHETQQLQQRIVDVSDKIPAIPVILPRKLIAWFSTAVVAPFVEFFKRNGVLAFVILIFIAVFRISDITMGVMANPFYLDLGYSKSEIASIAKVFGFFMTIAGSILGGLLVARFGLFRPLIIGAILVASTNLLFAWMAIQPKSLVLLSVIISADNLSGGISNVVFIAYLSSLTNTCYTATQYALFSSLMTLPGKFIGGFSGMIVDSTSYEAFFLYAAILGLPAILLAIYLMKKQVNSNIQVENVSNT